MWKIVAPIVMVLVILLLLPGCNDQPSEFSQKMPAQKIDLQKYLGTWYEIARLPSWFERDLVGVSATYSLKENGHIEVFNSGYKSTLDGEVSSAVGDAWLPDKEQTGRLKVSFFGPFTADYTVIVIDDNYQYAVVCSSPETLWILSRSPKMDDVLFHRLCGIAQNLGFNMDNLEKVPQRSN
ncbi:MAG: lipocalin family protein [Candidatus Margulisiibacteriota bacterium]|jgi:lipocalin